MKKFAFVSDFDGTLTHKDFYQIIIDKYMPEEGLKLYKEWQEEKMKDVDFLGYVFNRINKEEADIRSEILEIPLDNYAGGFISKIKENGGDFIILSAGTRYYIDILLAERRIDGATVISNQGVYKDKGIHLVLDTDSPYYSPVYGVDKRKFVESIRDEYEFICYAGDSKPDFLACQLADVIFAKGKLIKLLEDAEIPFYPFSEFSEIDSNLTSKGVLRK